MGCLGTLCEDFLRLVSFGYLVAGVALIWAVSILTDLTRPQRLLDVETFWFPDLAGVTGIAFCILGLIASFGAWFSRTCAVSWFAGASTVALFVEVVAVLAFCKNREAFHVASHHDDTGGLAAVLSWQEDNSTLVTVLVFVILGIQVLGMVFGSCYAVCSGPRHADAQRQRRERRLAREHGYTPLLPQTGSPAAFNPDGTRNYARSSPGSATKYSRPYR